MTELNNPPITSILSFIIVARLTIIALTAHALKEGVERALSAGMDEHLAMLMSIDQLRAAIVGSKYARKIE